MLEPLIKLKQENLERDQKLKAFDEKLADLERLRDTLQQLLLEHKMEDEGLVLKRINFEEFKATGNGAPVFSQESESLSGSPRKDTKSGNKTVVANSSKYADMWPLRVSVFESLVEPRV